MSRHEGVSCDSCLKTNFRCRRYKCLICYDYDLCANCYEEGVTSTRHLAEHPMQCILTRSDFDLYYGGEVLSSDQPQSFTCPFCKRMGFSDTALFEHVSTEHTDNGYEVVCPVCAAMPGGDPNLVTDDFAGHLTIEHRTGNRDLISFLDEPSAIRHGGVRRIPHSGRPINGPRPRRTNSGLPVIYPVGRDPTAEILFQLSGGRLGAPPPSQLQQLQTQIQLERQQVFAARQQLERLPRLPTVYTSLITGSTSTTSGTSASTSVAPQQTTGTGGIPSSSSNGLTILSNQLNQNQFLLNRFTSSLNEEENVEMEKTRADRSQFVHNLLLSTLSEDIDKNVAKTVHEVIGSKFSSEQTPTTPVISADPADNNNADNADDNDVVTPIIQSQQMTANNVQLCGQMQQQHNNRVVMPKQKSPPANQNNSGPSSKITTTTTLSMLNVDLKNRKTTGTQTGPTTTQLPATPIAVGGHNNKGRDLKTAAAAAVVAASTTTNTSTTSVCSSNRNDHSTDSR